MSVSSPNKEAEATFLVRHVGENVQHFSGLFIVHGRPAPVDLPLAALVDGLDCGEGIVSRGFGRTRYEMYVLSESEQADCAAAGESITFRSGGLDAGTATFEVRGSESLDLIVGSAPMYVPYWYDVPGLTGAVSAYVRGMLCGEGYLDVGALLPQNFQHVFVRSDATTLGCGAPGAVVDLKVGSRFVTQVLWREGRVHVDELEHVGDANCDTRNDSLDATLALQFGAGLLLQLECQDGADVNRDGTVDAVDAALILQRTAGLISHYP
jgi:hypothetical protein